MGDLTRHFSRHELACRCGCGFYRSSRALLRALEAIREELGQPLHVSSGCRCSEHNRAEGGSPRSLHLRGEAADVFSPGLTPLEIYRAAETMADRGLIGGIGLYPWGVHVDVGLPGRRWGKLPDVKGFVSIAEAVRWHEAEHNKVG